VGDFLSGTPPIGKLNRRKNLANKFLMGSISTIADILARGKTLHRCSVLKRQSNVQKGKGRKEGGGPESVVYLSEGGLLNLGGPGRSS